MKNNDFEKYISELSPELQEKARQCKDMAELNKLIAENDVELPDDALAAVAGGCSLSDDDYEQGIATSFKCPLCNKNMRYWDRYWDGDGFRKVNRYYCQNENCTSYQKGLWNKYGDSLWFE